jgi:hypothetical protein
MMEPTKSSFETPKGIVRIYDVIDGKNTEYLDALVDLYREFFPSYIPVLSRVREKAFLPANADPRFIRHQWVAVLEGEPIGLVSFKLSIKQNLGLGLSLAVRPAYRSLAWGDYRRFSHFLNTQMVRQQEIDASLCGLPPLPGIAVEVEMLTGPNDPRARLYEHYKEYGFVLLPITYHEPDSARNLLSPVEANMHPMKLFILPLHINEKTELFSADMLERVINTFLVEHYGLPEDHWIVQQARRSIEKPA